MVCLARAVKDAQADEKCCYHCSSPEHFINNCLLVKTSRERKLLNGKEEMALMKEAHIPPTTTNAMKTPRWKLLRHKTHFTDSLKESRPLSVLAWGKNIARVRINGDSCMALLDNGAQINTIMPKYVSNHSLQMWLVTNLLGTKVACMGLDNANMGPLDYIIIQAQVDRVQGYDKDQIALVITRLIQFCGSDSCHFRHPHHQLSH